jgi:hypothetical protein
LDLIAIEPGEPLDLDLRLESVSEGVLVTGTVHGPTRGECSRCLEPVTGDIEIALTELFAYPDSLTESTTESDEVGRVVDHTVDLAQPIIDAVGLALPFGTQFVIVLLALVTSAGIAGVPAASLVGIAVILGAVGLPAEAMVSDYIRTSGHAAFIREQIASLSAGHHPGNGNGNANGAQA